MNASQRIRILALMEAASVTGPAKNLLGFCKWLDTPDGRATGLSIAVATFDRSPGGMEGGFALAARNAGIETHVIRERHRFDLRVVSQLRAVVAAVRPQVIQTHNGKSHLLIRAQRRRVAEPVWFAFQHGYQDTDLKLRMYNQVDRFTLRAADRVVSVCQAFAPRLVAYGVHSDRIRILHNAAVATEAVADSATASLRANLGIRAGEAVIVTIGRLSREKGHSDLLRALALMKAPARNWKLVIVGVGPEREPLAQLADTLKLREQVVFAGFQPEVRNFYAIANIFVLPSRSEGSSNVLLEAMMARVPVVATRAGGNAEIVIDGQTGLLAPIDRPQMLAARIDEMLTRPDLAARLAAAAAVRAATEFSVERYQRRLVGFYTETLATPSTQPASAVG